MPPPMGHAGGNCASAAVAAASGLDPHGSGGRRCGAGGSAGRWRAGSSNGLPAAPRIWRSGTAALATAVAGGGLRRPAAPNLWCEQRRIADIRQRLADRRRLGAVRRWQELYSRPRGCSGSSSRATYTFPLRAAHTQRRPSLTVPNVIEPTRAEVADRAPMSGDRQRPKMRHGLVHFAAITPIPGRQSSDDRARQRAIYEPAAKSGPERRHRRTTRQRPL